MDEFEHETMSNGLVAGPYPPQSEQTCHNRGTGQASHGSGTPPFFGMPVQATEEAECKRDK
jgi:hypothetical protein